MRSFWREPLFHFVLLSGLVFLAVGLAGRSGDSRERTIYVSASEMERMAALFASEAGTLPAAEDVSAMLTDHVETAALAREARRLGLDTGDTVIERRLAQKMRFVVDDLTELPEPDDAALRDWHQTHGDRFRTPRRISFDHVFFADPDDPRLANAAAKLTDDAAPEWRRLGDPFMLQRQYGELPAREIARLFGTEFAAALAQVDSEGSWFGPIASAFGVHLVRVTSVSPSRLPPLEEIRSAVRADYLDAARRSENEAAIAEIVSRYDVEIEGLPE